LRSRFPIILGLLLTAPLVSAGDPAPKGQKAAPASPTPKTGSRADQIRAAAPIKNFRLPTFTAEGHRESMLRAGEAIIPDPDHVSVRDMDLTLFTRTAEEKIDARIVAPSANFLPRERIVRGSDTVLLERADLTVTGADWSYDHKARKLVINRDAHIVFLAPVGNVTK
jgi:hypothetical protein